MIKIRKNLFIGIDFGTAFTKVYVKNLGLVRELPTVIAFNRRNQIIAAIGEEAKKMIGRNPAIIDVVRPVIQGIVTNFDEALIFLEYILDEIKKDFWVLGGTNLIIGVPLNLTEVQKKAVIDVGKGCGAKNVFLVEEPIAATLGANLNVDEIKGVLIVDIGGGTTDIALISLGNVVVGRSIRIGGDSFNEKIIDYLKTKYGILIGEGQAEMAKVSIGSINGNAGTFLIKGRDILTGAPKETNFTNQDLKESITEDLEEIVVVIKDIINLSPPDLLGDIIQSGIYLAGGGSLLEGIETFFEKGVKLKINLVEEPKYAVIRGIGKIIEDFDNLKKLLFNV